MRKSFLQDTYTSWEEFRQYDAVYGLSRRLGFREAGEAWDANPLVQSSTNPADYGRADTSEFTDGEVIGMDADERLIRWNQREGRAYKSVTLDEYGDHNLTATERRSLGIVWLASDKA